MYILYFLICQAHNGIKLSKILRGVDRILKGGHFLIHPGFLRKIIFQIICSVLWIFTVNFKVDFSPRGEVVRTPDPLATSMDPWIGLS
jgi:membrane-associated PAP2 superfamily phosphatase